MGVKYVQECPYIPGQTLTLRVEDQSTTRTTLDVKIISTFEPFELSCTMLVEVNDARFGLEGRFILKIFDRRYAQRFRVDAGPSNRKDDPQLTSWSLEIENQYRQFVQSGQVLSFFNFCSETDSWDFRCDYLPYFDPGQLEASFQYTLHKWYTAETELYHRLEDRQGIDIPHFHAKLSISSLFDNADTEGYFLDCPGILLQFVPDFPLSDLANSAPRDTWQGICDEAIEIVKLIRSCDIRNEDVQPWNIIIRKDQSTGRLKPVMIDFSRCVFRKEGQSDHDWERRQAEQDEEGAIGCVMKARLKDGFEFKRSAESKWLTHKYMRDERYMSEMSE